LIFDRGWQALRDGKAITDGMKTRFVEGAAVLEKPYTAKQPSQALSAHFSFNPEARSNPDTRRSRCARWLRS
jgi:hypothetical protein